MCARCGHGILKRGASLRPICHVRRRLSAIQPPLRNESVESTGTEHSECHAEVALTSISSGVTSKAANGGHFKTGQRKWPGTRLFYSVAS